MTRQNPPRDERTLERRLAELERRLQVLETTPAIIPWQDIPAADVPWADVTFGAWIDITFNAGYSAALTGGLGFGRLAQYRFRSVGEIEMQGTVQKGTGAGGVGANGFANGDTPFQMPAGARPPQLVYYPIRCSAGGAANSYGVVGSEVQTGGNFIMRTNIANAPGWISLDGIHYEIA